MPPVPGQPWGVHTRSYASAVHNTRSSSAQSNTTSSTRSRMTQLSNASNASSVTGTKMQQEHRGSLSHGKSSVSETNSSHGVRQTTEAELNSCKPDSGFSDSVGSGGGLQDIVSTLVTIQRQLNDMKKQLSWEQENQQKKDEESKQALADAKMQIQLAQQAASDAEKGKKLAEKEIQKIQAQLQGSKEELGALLREDRKERITPLEKLLYQRFSQSRDDLKKLKEEKEQLQNETRDLKSEIGTLNSTLNLSQQTITQLNNDIAEISNQRPEQTTDDRSFNQEFVQLFLSIQDWVLNYYEGSHLSFALQYDMNFIPIELQNHMEEVVGEFWRLHIETKPVLVVQALTAYAIVTKILQPFLLSSFDTFYSDAKASCSSEHKDDLKTWRVLTTSIARRTPAFQHWVGEGMSKLAKNFESILLPFRKPVTPKQEQSRLRLLESIFLRAANLAMLCHSQPSTFRYSFNIEQTRRSESHARDLYTDVEAILSDEELDKSGVRIGFVVSPLVQRESEETGHRVVIQKARVSLWPRRQH